MKYYIQIDCMGREKPIVKEFDKDEIVEAFESITNKCVNNEGFIAFTDLDAEEPSAIAIRKSSINIISILTV